MEPADISVERVWVDDHAQRRMEGRSESAPLLIIVTVLVAFGIVMIYSAAAVVSDQSVRFGDRLLFLRRQGIWACVGTLALLATATIPYRFWYRMRHWLLGLSFLLLVAVYLPGIGLKLNGEHRWIRLGPYQLQPSEVCRLTLAIVICAAVTRPLETWRRFLPWAGVILAASALVLFERDVGSAVVLAALLSMILFVGGARLRHIAITGGIALVLVSTAVFHVYPKALERINAYLGAHSSYQVDQSVLAVGAGGLFGDGLGSGRAKLFYLPEAQSDFIFATVAEELGFLGACGLILLYLALLAAGARIARRCTDPFGQALTVAVVASISLGAAINICVATGALPAKGIPLPFISYGGSSLLMSMAAVGILMNIADSTGAHHEAADLRGGERGTPDAGDRPGPGLAPAGAGA